jgi:hypothetical protein
MNPLPDRDAEPVCPVCRSSGEDSALCGQCGWELLGGYVLGPATPAAERELAGRLLARQRQHDLRAAARAAGADDALLRRLADLARGGCPEPGQLERAVAEARAETPAASSRGMLFALTRLIGRETDAIVFVEIGVDSVAAETLVADDVGRTFRLRGDRLTWTAILPRLPEDADLRLLQMAGGVGPGGPGPAVLEAAAGDAIRPALARLTAAAAAAAAVNRGGGSSFDSSPHEISPRLDSVLVLRTKHWPVLDAAAATARMAIRPVTEVIAGPDAGPLGALVDRAARQAPLRYGYDLILVEVDQDSGVVRPDPYPLFPPGASRQPEGRPVSVTIEPTHDPGRTRYLAHRLSLPIVARRGNFHDIKNPKVFKDPGVLGRDWPLVRMTAIDHRGGPAPLHIRLRAPGQVAVQAGSDVLADDTAGPGWPQLLTDLPDRLVREKPAALDLVLMVELGGTAEAVGARVRLARDMVDTLGTAEAVRVAVVGYRDHFGKHRVDAGADREHERLVVGCGLSPLDRARSVFRRAERWEAVPVGDYRAAPVEDALQLVAGSAWRWTYQARHVLLTIGQRPPHPARAGRFGDPMLPCPHRFSWQHSLRVLRGNHVECIAVLDQRAEPGYAEQSWRDLSTQGQFTLKEADPARLMHLVGLANRPATAPLRLARHAKADPGAAE